MWCWCRCSWWFKSNRASSSQTLCLFTVIRSIRWTPELEQMTPFTLWSSPNDFTSWCCWCWCLSLILCVSSWNDNAQSLCGIYTCHTELSPCAIHLLKQYLLCCAIQHEKDKLSSHKCTHVWKGHTTHTNTSAWTHATPLPPRPDSTRMTWGLCLCWTKTQSVEMMSPQPFSWE